MFKLVLKAALFVEAITSIENYSLMAVISATKMSTLLKNCYRKTQDI